MKTLVADPEKNEEEKCDRGLISTVKFLLNTANHIFIGFVFIYSMWICWKRGFDEVFTWHVVLCVIGFHVLMAESILVFYSGNSWSQALKQPQRRTVHWVMQVGGCSCIFVGIGLEIYWREINNKRHFHGAHSILGLIALILLALSMANGVGSLYAIELRKRIKPIYMKLSHHVISLACFVVGMSAIVLGYEKRIFYENTSPEMQTTLKVFTCFVIVLSLLGALRTIFTQMKTLLRS